MTVPRKYGEAAFGVTGGCNERCLRDDPWKAGEISSSGIRNASRKTSIHNVDPFHSNSKVFIFFILGWRPIGSQLFFARV